MHKLGVGHVDLSGSNFLDSFLKTKGPGCGPGPMVLALLSRSYLRPYFYFATDFGVYFRPYFHGSHFWPYFYGPYCWP